MGHDNNDVGSKSSTAPDRRADHNGHLVQQQMGDQAPVPGRRAGVHSAMSQQGNDSGRGTESVPQKLVQLVGYRDPNSYQDASIRSRTEQR